MNASVRLARVLLALSLESSRAGTHAKIDIVPFDSLGNSISGRFDRAVAWAARVKKILVTQHVQYLGVGHGHLAQLPTRPDDYLNAHVRKHKPRTNQAANDHYSSTWNSSDLFIDGHGDRDILVLQHCEVFCSRFREQYEVAAITIPAAFSQRIGCQLPGPEHQLKYASPACFEPLLRPGMGLAATALGIRNEQELRLSEWARNRSLPWGSKVSAPSECGNSSWLARSPSDPVPPVRQPALTLPIAHPVTTRHAARNSFSLEHFSRNVTPGVLSAMKRAKSGDSSSSGEGPSLAALKLTAKVYAPLLQKSLLKQIMGLEEPSTSSTAARRDNRTAIGLAVAVELERSMKTLADRRYRETHGVKNADFASSMIAGMFNRRNQVSVSSFVEDPSATSTFCADYIKLPRRSAPRTAVCLVGVPRTMVRADVRDGFLYRFLAGWGSSTVSIFAVLVDVGDTAERDAVYSVLSDISTVSAEWFPQETVTQDGGVYCRDGSESRQLKQWARCLKMIEEYERKAKGKFDVVIKARPDDLWFGPMVPHCVLDVKNVALISRQELRWSDQWFVLPRAVAQRTLDVANRGLKPHCAGGAGSKNVNISKIRKAGSPPFEDMIFAQLAADARAFNVDIVPSLYPRIISRAFDPRALTASERHDVHVKCERFMWYVARDDCARAVFPEGRVPSFADGLRAEQRLHEQRLNEQRLSRRPRAPPRKKDVDVAPAASQAV